MPKESLIEGFDKLITITGWPGLDNRRIAPDVPALSISRLFSPAERFTVRYGMVGG
ncbi:hypothetical protein W02_17140 [Nitrospira sp. KM1]|nr:hypothetical protein W02_17140 [Nitrospira sp. KM1]